MNNKNGESVFFDVDDTLVYWTKPKRKTDSIFVKIDNVDVELFIHKEHVVELKRLYKEGYTVVVWSAGGKEWVDSIIDLLGLKNFVDFTIKKPIAYYDDMEANWWLTKSGESRRVFFSENIREGSNNLPAKKRFKLPY